MADMLTIRSVKNYFNEFIVKGLEGKTKVQEIDMIPIKNQILDSFRREIFGQVVFKLGPEAANLKPDELANIDGIQNILQQSFRKWRRFCILCSEHGLGGFFRLEDLKTALNDGVVEDLPVLEEDVTGQVPDDTVIVDEKTMKPIGMLANLNLRAKVAEPEVVTSGYVDIVEDGNEATETEASEPV